VHPIKSFVRRFAVVAVALAATAAVVAPASASNSVGDPVATTRWGIYQGSGDGLWPAYQHSSGLTHQLLAKMALHARVRSYGSWISTGDIRELISSDIAQEQGGNPNVLVWMGIFRLWPHEEAANHVPMTAAQQQAYRDWIDAAARGIGSAKVGIVLEPDFPLTLDSWGPKVRAGLVRYAAQELSSLPNASVYIDGGSADWLSVPELVKLLEAGGIQYARGISLGASHHVSTGSEIAYCRLVGLSLARDGYPNKRCVIDTSDNGHPYTNKQFYEKYPRGSFNADNPPACTTPTQKVCVALGIPPTTDVSDPKWGLPAGVDKMAAHWVDAYVWTGHPWKINNGHDFDLQHALDAARTDPYL
jgi:hypothetical protein